LVGFLLLLVASVSFVHNRCLGVYPRPLGSTRPEGGDYYDGFGIFEKVLFKRFADSVSVELSGSSETSARNYAELMGQINKMSSTRPLPIVNQQGRNMLVRLFPSWLLPAFRVMFARPFPRFSAWMNSWVTKWTTNWLMGKSEIQDLELKDGSIGKDQLLVVEKCRFLEETGCARTCLHTCKIATQSFFLEDMGIPVTLQPNFTDYSCRFEFGNVPIDITEDPEIMSQPCLSICSQPKKKSGVECVVRNPM
jgi:hypothetical protein